jgi:hypothetical protein
MDGAPLAPPSGGSPFSPFGAASNAVITVGDILSQLPPEIARANGAMPDQPVTISPQALEAAISSGQLAVPMFEIYRVCPALFQAPVSPHDPRLVPLPRNKLPGLIAAHTGALAKPAQQPQSAGASPFGQAASPFAAAPMQMPPAYGQQAPASPFAPALPDLQPPQHYEAHGSPATGGVRPAGTLPPRRPQGMPPAIPTQADFAGAPGMLTLPGQPHYSDPARPSSQPMMMPRAEVPAQPAASPFGAAPFAAMPQQQPVSNTSLLFGSQQASADPELEAAPMQRPQMPMQSFGHNPQPTPSASPFASAPSSQFAAPSVASFEVPQRHVESEPPRIGNLPFSAQATPAHTPAARPQSRPLGGVAPSAGGNSDSMEVSLAAVLKGLTPQELGFDPSFIPGWINTKLPSYDVRSQLASGQVVLDLGTIIDGTDSTFKSVIAHGNRDFKVHIRTSEVFQSMPPAATTPAAPAFSPVPAAAAPVFAVPALPPTPTGPLQPMFAQQPMNRPPTQPLQPMNGAFGSLFGAPPQASPQSSPSTAPLIPNGPSPRPVSPSVGEFASTPMFMPAQVREGMGSQQLFGGESKDLSAMFSPAPSPFAPPATPAPAANLFTPAPEARPHTGPLFAPAPQAQTAEPNPFFSAAQSATSKPQEPAFGFEESRTPSMPVGMMANMAKVFGAPSEAAPAPAPAKPAPAPAAWSAPAPSSSSAFGLSANVDEEQLVLRAMLGVSDKLDIGRVVELAARLPGVSACAFVRDNRATAHGDDSAPSQNFRQQASAISQSMRTLAEVTGLDAETLSIATNERLITFCFQGSSAFGVLHTDKTPPPGLREKITLLSREVGRMSA